MVQPAVAACPTWPWQVLHDVGYQDGACVRPIIHRMSLVGGPAQQRPALSRAPSSG